jgi:hypothetical protein
MSAQPSLGAARGLPEVTLAEPCSSYGRSSEMPEPQLSNEEVANLTRAYLLRRSAQPYPRDLESRALKVATSERRHRGLSWIVVSALVTIVALGAIGVAFALAHDTAPSPARFAPVPAPPSGSRSPLRGLRAPPTRTGFSATPQMGSFSQIFRARPATLRVPRSCRSASRRKC